MMGEGGSADEKGTRPADRGLAAEMQALREQFGGWATHNIRLADDLFTIGPAAQGSATKLGRVVQIISDIVGDRPFGELRMLDLACNEGLYALEFASRGARVVAVDGRDDHLAKARFAQRALGIETLEFVHDDVRNLSRERLGTFDVVLCAGILYHLDAPDVFEFVRAVAGMTKGFAIIDTHVSPYGADVVEHDGASYHGMFAAEHAPDSSAEDRLAAGLQSLENQRAFHLTKPSLLNLLVSCGFSSVLECHAPGTTERRDTRPTLVAFTGSAPRLNVSPQSAVLPWRALPERAGPSRPLLGLKQFRRRLRRLLRHAFSPRG
jgi:2-polyprenyl-3-methyl-5-hydroxy-6-metoxy-1,4-benzoquinol methylase